MQESKQTYVLEGLGGQLEISAQDKVARQLAMLFEVKLLGISVGKAAKKYNYTEARYYQIQKAFKASGSQALQPKKTGPKSNYVRNENTTPQVIRHRFLDRDAGPAVIAQKLCQTGVKISQRSVSRVIKEYGLQKKTLPVSPQRKRAAS